MMTGIIANVNLVIGTVVSILRSTRTVMNEDKPEIIYLKNLNPLVESREIVWEKKHGNKARELPVKTKALNRNRKPCPP